MVFDRPPRVGFGQPDSVLSPYSRPRRFSRRYCSSRFSPYSPRWCCRFSVARRRYGQWRCASFRAHCWPVTATRISSTSTCRRGSSASAILRFAGWRCSLCRSGCQRIGRSRRQPEIPISGSSRCFPSLWACHFSRCRPMRRCCRRGLLRPGIRMGEIRTSSMRPAISAA